jgi:hypothetical protein
MDAIGKAKLEGTRTEQEAFFPRANQKTGVRA